MQPRFFFLLPLLLPPALAAFTHHGSDCWNRDCVVRMDAGTFCFEPHDGGTVHEECTEGFLKNLTQVHLTNSAGRSIVYYDDKASMLGAATWSLPPTRASPVFVCMTGRRLDNSKRYHTICRQAHGDDDMNVAAVHANECISDQKPQYVSDGCFILDKSEDTKGDRKEWYEQPVVAGLVWALGTLVILQKLYLWGGKVKRVVQACLSRRCTHLLRDNFELYADEFAQD